jgi:hypothetical protein
METARYTGGCACGQVKYDITGEPVRMLNCHCRDCQRASGSAYAALLAFEQKSVKLTGELRYYGVTSERGNRLERGFCPNCGNPVTIKPGARPNLLYVQAGSLDDPSLHKPTAHIWVRSAPPWDHIDPRVPRFDTRQPQ